MLSPLLANLYLHDLDLLITKEGGKIVRYADDFVILTKSQAEAQRMLEKVEMWTKENELILHPDKTHIGNCLEEGQGFEFLGYRFENKKKWIRNKSIQKFREKIRNLTKRTCGQAIEKIIQNINPFLEGWYEYFKHVNRWTLNTFDAFVRRRLRAILRKQNKRPGYGRNFEDHKTWPNEYFAKLNLFAMETKRRLEIACQSR